MRDAEDANADGEDELFYWLLLADADAGRPKSIC